MIWENSLDKVESGVVYSATVVVCNSILGGINYT